jgi:hypothetical protein
VVHVTGEVDTIRDVEIVNTELMIADLEALEKARGKLSKAALSGEREVQNRVRTLERCVEHLNEGNPLKTLDLHEDELLYLREFGLITLKPVLYCANIDEENSCGGQVKRLEVHARNEHSAFITLSGKLEEEISELPDDEKQEYLQGMGVGESGLKRLIRASYELLDLITYYTAATELQAWTLRRGTNALHAAGKIHTDFERGFIRAEVYGFDDLIAVGNEHAVREAGKLRSEGKDYVIRDGDIVRYLFNV